MNRKIPAEFGPEVRFALSAAAAVPFRAVQENEFERLKAQLTSEQLAQAWEPEVNSSVRRAANEAASLAWVTPYPLLVFPVLFEEKATAAFARAERQQEITTRTRELLAI